LSKDIFLVKSFIKDPISSVYVKLLAARQTNRKTNAVQNITLSAQVTNRPTYTDCQLNAHIK